ncbi:beta-ketoacyl-[acyl-carrier-protein] synthase family protein [Bacteroides propionicifaciens]|uniref:beta-ketoacyl-[acyl-carrier-protein] synthase family protein n=1 Tax=Bacteroides propionicifaciens TaxID=392838 RepID=UPI00037CE57C|nr:beta-ketoacyl-[acyl-carrier-protein] synthase family protein [Bacteroides propionicifaciens]
MIKVFVTGVGVISAIGTCLDENMQALRLEKTGIGVDKYLSTKLQVPVGQVKYSNEELKSLLGLNTDCIISRTALLGMLAAKEAIIDANLEFKTQKIGLISATSVGGIDLSENFYKSFREDPNSGGNLEEVLMHDCSASTLAIAQHLGIEGFTSTISTACSSASNAIMLGARMIKAGMLDTVLVGGTDALCRFTLNGFNSLKLLDEEVCRPFDQNRKGLNLGEGAGFLVLQDESCLSRTPYCELTGYSNVNEAYHQAGSTAEGDGAFAAMTEALRVAGLQPSEIDYVNVHGTGTPTNDSSEGNALKRLFGNQVPAFSSVKSYIGHTLGASEGIEAVYSVLSVAKGYIYPNLNFEDSMVGLNLYPATKWEENARIKHVLSNSFGFGGNNSSLVFSAIK